MAGVGESRGRLEGRASGGGEEHVRRIGTTSFGAC